MRHIIFNLLDLSIKISCPSNYFLKKINKRYNGFIGKIESKPSFELDIKNPISFRRRTNYYINKNTSNELRLEFNITKDYSSIKIDKKRNNGIYYTRKKDLYHFNLILPIIIRILLNGNKGTGFHATSIINNRKGYIFFGSSGSGKTTICKSLKKGIILHDDMTLIREINGKFKVGSVPRKTLLKNICKKNKSAELKACFRIIKSNKNKLVKLSKKDALKLIKQATQDDTCAWQIDKYINTKKQSQVLSNLVKKVDIYDLYFRKKCDFWGLINEIK